MQGGGRGSAAASHVPPARPAPPHARRPRIKALPSASAGIRHSCLALLRTRVSGCLRASASCGRGRRGASLARRALTAAGVLAAGLDGQGALSRGGGRKEARGWDRQSQALHRLSGTACVPSVCGEQGAEGGWLGKGQAAGSAGKAVALAPPAAGQPWEQGAARPGHLLLAHDTCPWGRVFQAQLSRTKMSCYDLCPPKTGVAVPQPIAESCNELCARQCPDSTAFIQPPPVVVTFPGPILSSFPQQAVVGSSGAPAFGGSLGLGGLYGAGATQGSGGLCTFGRPYASPACSPCVLPRYGKKLWDTCGPC